MAKNEKWFLTAKRADFQEIANRFQIDPVTARVIRNRDVIGMEEIEKYLHGTLADLHDPMLLRDMDKAVTILRNKIAGGARMRIIGDYDIDGVMSSYILWKGFRMLGAFPDVRIPERMVDGYGVSMRLVEEAHADGMDTIITCDNGIAAAAQIARAKELGMTVIVTDHHEVAGMPPADAVIDPHRPDCPYPYKELCGGAVAYKLMDALFTACGKSGEEIRELLPFAAFATVGDIMDLTGENRILVKEGIRLLQTSDHPGLTALSEVCGVSLAAVDPYHIGFVLGPCINAGGRLDSAMRAFSLMTADSVETARPIAEELRSLNESRKALTEEGVAAAMEAVEEALARNDKVFVIYLPKVHESIAGIIAGRIREALNHPVFILTKGTEGVKGSGRSIPGYSMFEELRKCDDLLMRYGGHPLAAGLSLPEEAIEPFRERLNANCTLADDSFAAKVTIDCAMPISYVTEELVEELDALAPFGKGNEKPLFAQKNLRAENFRLIGARQNVLKIRLRAEDGATMDGIAFRDAAALNERLQENPVFTAAYYPTVNSYLGRKTLQAVIEHWM